MPAILTEATTDEIAGWILERWHLLYPRVILCLDENEMLALRIAILTGLRAAVEMDRDGRLDKSSWDVSS